MVDGTLEHLRTNAESVHHHSTPMNPGTRELAILQRSMLNVECRVILPATMNGKKGRAFGKNMSYFMIDRRSFPAKIPFRFCGI
jgi:hypothetical protein